MSRKMTKEERSKYNAYDLEIWNSMKMPISTIRREQIRYMYMKMMVIKDKYDSIWIYESVEDPCVG